MSTPTRPLPPKKDVALDLLQGPSLFIHLDPRKPEVGVPAYFKKQAQLVLQVGLNMAIAIPDLKVDDEGVTCTLSFNRRPFWCRLPWSAIYALVGEDMKGMIWPDDVPAEVAAAQREKAPEQSKSADTPRARPGRGAPKKKLASVISQAAESKSDAPSSKTNDAVGSMRPPTRPVAPPQAPVDAEGAKPSKRELPPYLRVVK